MPPPADASSIPVPEEASGSVSSSTSLPWSSLPKFIPGTTNVQEYTQKMKFIASIWPKEHLEVLAPRAALLVEGAAFHKVMRISPEKLKTNSVDGVITLVETLGGSWGMTMLEEQYETFERALYGTLQKSDESHDSYVARSEVHFEELLARGTTLEEIRAYVLLRQSTLSPDDRKKIVLDQGGKLRYPEVTKASRLLGSPFFQDLQGNKSSKTKVYDVNLTECDSEPAFAASHDAESGVSHPASSTEALTFLTALDDEVDGDYIEALVAQNDEDACAVQQFEQELEEFLQDTPSMHDALVTYIDARQKLQDKRKTRGFWPVQSSSNPYSKGGKKGKAAKGGGKAKNREQLLARIARSHCRACGERGHWRAECPNRANSSTTQTRESANLAEASFDSGIPPLLESLSDPAEDVLEVFSDASQASVDRPTDFESIVEGSKVDRGCNLGDSATAFVIQCSSEQHQRLIKNMQAFCHRFQKPSDSDTSRSHDSRPARNEEKPEHRPCAMDNSFSSLRAIARPHMQS